jgi:hypothetical protein
MSLKQAEQLFDQRAKILARVFHTDGGAEALKLLQDLFDLDDCRGATVEDTYYKLGQREVVKYIETLLRRVGDV